MDTKLLNQLWLIIQGMHPTPPCIQPMCGHPLCREPSWSNPSHGGWSWLSNGPYPSAMLVSRHSCMVAFAHPLPVIDTSQGYQNEFTRAWLVNVLLAHIPNLLARSYNNNPIKLKRHVSFWSREWNKHEMTSGMTLFDFFHTIIHLFLQVPKYHVVGL